MIRVADPENDYVAVLYGAGEFSKLVNRPDLFPEAGSDELAGLVRKLMATPGFTVLLAYDGAYLEGGIGYWVGPYLMSLTKTEFQELFWWGAQFARPATAMLLLREALRRGKEAGAQVKTLHRLMTSPDGVDAAYRRVGVTPMQVTYMGVF